MRELTAEIFGAVSLMMFIVGFGRIVRWVWFEASLSSWLIGLITIIMSIILLIIALIISPIGGNSDHTG